MGFYLSKLIGALLTPGALLLLSLAIATGCLWSRKRWRTGRAVLTTLTVLLVALSVLPLDAVLNRMLEDRFPGNPPLPDKIDGVIILGGVIDPVLTAARGQISLSGTAERLFEGVRLAKLHPEAKVVFTGGSNDPFRAGPKEAPLAARALEDLGIAAERIIIEDASRNTYENAIFSDRLIQPAKGQVWVLITSARHMPRAVGVFRNIGWSVLPWPVDYSTEGKEPWVTVDMPVSRLRLLTDALHEWVGLAFYRVSGWTSQFFPGP